MRQDKMRQDQMRQDKTRNTKDTYALVFDWVATVLSILVLIFFSNWCSWYMTRQTQERGKTQITGRWCSLRMTKIQYNVKSPLPHVLAIRHLAVVHDVFVTRQVKTRQETRDKTRQDKTRQNKTKQDKTRQGKTRQDKTRQDKTTTQGQTSMWCIYVCTCM